MELYSPRGTEYASNSIGLLSISSKELFQPLPVGDLMAIENATVCRRVQEVYRARTTMLGESASAVVSLIDRLTARLHTLTADNR